MSRRAMIGGLSAATFGAPVVAAPRDQATGVVELRQYTLHPGRRDDLIDLFERHFIEPQEAVGAKVLGTFRDLDDPDRFVWLRGFADMATRADALTRFYGGPVWQRHRDAANATMLDSENVLLLLPAPATRHAFECLSSPNAGTGIYGLTLHYIGGVDPMAFAAFFARAVLPMLKRRRLSPVTITSARIPNNFPRLPTRENEQVFGWLSRWDDERMMHATWRDLDQAAGWREAAGAALMPTLMRKPERLRLAPTASSKLR